MIEDIALPKKWKELSEEEQREWIRTHYMPKARIPEPILARKAKVKKGKLQLENGTEIEFPTKNAVVSKSNPNIVREFCFWVGKWQITIFHDKSMPHTKYLSVGNPSTKKWIAQELSHEILSKLFTALCKIGNKYRLFRRKEPKTQRKRSDSALSLRDDRGETDG